MTPNPARSLVGLGVVIVDQGRLIDVAVQEEQESRCLLL